MDEARLLSEVKQEDLVKKKSKLLLRLTFLFFSFFLLVFLGLLFFLGTGYSSRDITESILKEKREKPSHEEISQPDKVIADSEAALAELKPSKIFIVIDHIHNHLWLREGNNVALDALISTGAGSILKDPNGDREWVFDTPTGRFKVKGKRERPLWTAPDWEYIEANEPFPKRYSDRTQEGMLGEYALDLDVPGYLIHGTLYTRLIGRNVSHGCIRVGRDDLRVIWKKVPVGSTVFIF